MSAARGLLLDVGVVFASSSGPITADVSGPRGVPVRSEALALGRACFEAGLPAGILATAPMDVPDYEWIRAWFRYLPAHEDEPYRAAVEHLCVPAPDVVLVDDHAARSRQGREAGLRSVLLEPDDPTGAFRKAVLQLGLPWSVLG